MDLKKPGFGGPNSAIGLRDAKGKKINKNPKLDKYQRTVERDPIFSHPVYDPTYKAMSHDLVYKQEGKKPFTYRDPYLTAVPVVQYDFMKEGKSYTSFTQFINERSEGVTGKEERVDLRGKGDADALSDAEEKLFQRNIDWDEFNTSPDGTRVDYMDQDGDLVAYVDVKSRKMYIMPEAGEMTPERRRFLTGEESPEEELDFEDEYERMERTETDEFDEGFPGENIEDMEDFLRSFED
jgi:hypothetical protein